MRWIEKAPAYSAAVCALILAAFMPSSVRGQSTELHIASNRPDALVLADGRFLGRISESPFLLDAAVDSVVVQAASITTWNAETIRLRVPTSPGVVLRADFPYRYAIDSIPGKAMVLDESAGRTDTLGVTPWRASFAEPLRKPLRVELEGFESVSVHPEMDVSDFKLVTLRPLEPTMAVHTSIDDPRRRWIDVVSLSGAVLAGALAVHFRTKADHRFEEWEADKSNQLKREVQRLDVMSGVSVGVMQVGIGVFAFRLVF